MDRILSASTSESSPANSRLWIGRFVVAVVLGEATWGFLVSLTNNLVLPAMARAMAGDAQSPLSLGKGDFNVPGLFASILELCFAGIVALVVNSWSQKSGRVRSYRARAGSIETPPVRVTPVEPPATPVVAASAPVPTAAVNPTAAAPTPIRTVPPAPQPPPATAQATKPKKEKAVYYNIVGEPIDPDE